MSKNYEFVNADDFYNELVAAHGNEAGHDAVMQTFGVTEDNVHQLQGFYANLQTGAVAEAVWSDDYADPPAPDFR
jgi:hypothetical protein